MDIRRQWVLDTFAHLRGQMGLSFADIARATGVSRQYVSQVYAGKAVSDEFVEAVVKAFNLPGISVADVNTAPPAPTPPSPGFARLQESLEKLIAAHTRLMELHSRCEEEIDALKAKVRDLEGRVA